MRTLRIGSLAVAFGLWLLCPEAARAAVTLSPPSLAFGDVLLGADGRLSLVLTNTSTTAPVDVNAITSTDARFTVCLAATAPGPCSPPTSWPRLEVAPGTPTAPNTLEVVVQFTPTALGAASTTLTVDTSEGVQAVPAQGKGIAVDLVLLFDNSGSMQWLPDGTDKGGPIPLDPGSRMQLAKNSATQFVSLMNGLAGIGNVRVGVCLFNSTGTPADGCVRDLLAFDLGALVNVISGNDTNQVRIVWAGTQMGRGLTTAEGKLASAVNRKRAIVMLSDGAHNQGPPPEGVLAAADGLPLFALGYGTSNNVEPQRLKDLVVGSGNTVEEGFRHFDPVACAPEDAQCVTTANGGKTLNAFFADLLHGLGLVDAAVDPQATIRVGETQAHDVPVVELDRTAQFVMSTDGNFPPGLAFDLLDPQGQVVDPAVARQDPDVELLGGPGFAIYRVGEGYLRRPGKLGTWKMRLRYQTQVFASHVVGPQPPFTYSYSALMASRLHLSVAFDRAAYATGDPILLTARVTANGRRLSGAEVDRIEIALDRPRQGIGTWFARNEAKPEWVGAIPAERSGEALSPVQRNGLALTLVGKVAAPGRAPAPPLVLHDDGTGGDVQAGDGVYSARFTDTSKPDTYTFHVVARGRTPKGLAFTREALVQQLVSVNVRPDPSTSPLVFEKLESPERDVTRVRVKVVPKDRFQNYLGPAYGSLLDFQTTAGGWVGPVEDDLRGGYTRVLDFRPGAESPQVTVIVGGKSFPPQDVKRRLEPRRFLEVFAGGFFFEGGVPVEDGVVVGLRTGAQLREALHLEAEVGVTPTEDDTGKSGNVIQVIGGLRLDVQRLALGPVVPFVTAGGGWLRFDGFSTEDSSGLAMIGLGVRVPLGSRLRLRVDARDLIGFDTYGSTRNNLQATAGVAYGF